MNITGKSTWIQQIADTFLSKTVVHAQTPTPQKKTFTEDISLQFFIAQDYTMTVEGVIELTNSSGKDISLTQYDMNLPYFTLKNTKIGYIYPKAFLVDMYSENNSILFTFKSQYTKPVVIGKNGKITFTFSAQVDKPYRDLGGLRTLSFPFMLTEEGRTAKITVTVNDKLPLAFSPTVVTQLKGKNIFPVTDSAGKLFIFATSDTPVGLTFSHSTEVPLPQLSGEKQCTTYLPVACIGCGSMSIQESGQTAALRGKDSSKVVAQITRQMSPNCATSKYKTMDVTKWKTGSFNAGYLISPSTSQLIPASWRVMTQDGQEYIKDVITNGVPSGYVDSLGLLTIPLKSCGIDDECSSYANQLQTIDTALSTAPEFTSPGISDDPTKVQLAIKQEGRRFSLLVTNTSETFLTLSSLELQKNQYFALNDSIGHIIAPKETLTLYLDTKRQLQTTNQETQLKFMVNKAPNNITFKPITITILTVIELLAYAFIISLGITLVSVTAIFLYNRYYEKKIPTQT